MDKLAILRLKRIAALNLYDAELHITEIFPIICDFMIFNCRFSRLGLKYGEPFGENPTIFKPNQHALKIIKAHLTTDAEILQIIKLAESVIEKFLHLRIRGKTQRLFQKQFIAAKEPSLNLLNRVEKLQIIIKNLIKLPCFFNMEIRRYTREDLGSLIKIYADLLSYTSNK